MRSVCLEGYDYTVFDLTKLDRVQIQVWLQKLRNMVKVFMLTGLIYTKKYRSKLE